MGLLKPVLGPRVPVPVQRQTLELATRAMGTGAAGAARANVGGVPGDRVLPRGAPAARTILYLHGGGYVIGSAHGYRAMTTRIAAAAEAEVVAPDYRRAPENPYPAARDDALSAYEA